MDRYRASLPGPRWRRRVNDIAIEGLHGSTSHAPLLEKDSTNIKFIMQVVKELSPPPGATGASRIPPQNCEIPDVPGKAATPRLESLGSGRVIDLPEPLGELELGELLIRGARALQDPDRPLVPIARKGRLAAVPVAVGSLHLRVRCAE
eukprot:6845381-Pyramimonas_sp.AAC.1